MLDLMKGTGEELPVQKPIKHFGVDIVRIESWRMEIKWVWDGWKTIIGKIQLGAAKGQVSKHTKK